MLRTINILIVFLTCFICQNSFAQTTTPPVSEEKVDVKTDSVRARKHPPRAAMLMSVCLPGLGQVYNRKYWKVPLVYASMGTTLYFFNFNHKLYRGYKEAYIARTDTVVGTVDNIYTEYSDAQLKELQGYHQKYRDLNVILTALFYTINIVDAYVDAHLMRFDVSDDLSFHVLPSLQMQAYRRKPSAGLTLTMTF